MEAKEIKKFFLTKLQKDCLVINKKEVLEKAEKCSDKNWITHGSDWRVAPSYVYSTLCQYFGVETGDIF
jgi:hypothetical protein